MSLLVCPPAWPVTRGDVIVEFVAAAALGYGRSTISFS
jgi:hypothetical protein